MCNIQKTCLIDIYNIDPPNTLEVRGGAYCKNGALIPVGALNAAMCIRALLSLCFKNETSHFATNVNTNYGELRPCTEK